VYPRLVQMLIIGVNSSPRGEASRTRSLVRAVLDGAASEGAETEYRDLCSLRIEYCTGCASCYATGDCILEDDFFELFARLREADGIVFGSPVYIRSVTAQLKTFYDRCADAIHCQMFTGKYGCAVTTSGGGGDEEVIAYMNRVFNMLGGIAIGGKGVALGQDLEALFPAEAQAGRLGAELALAIREKKFYPEQEAIVAETREHMKNLVTANKDRWWHEYHYWVEQGWIEE
jgi:multimeric flavodoxin WrbA